MKPYLSRSIPTSVAVAALAATFVAAVPASAHGGGGGVRQSGACSGGGAFTLKAKHDDGRIEVEYEVDTDHSGQVWHVRLRDNGALVLSRTATTRAPSGSFSVGRTIANRAGVDTITARATRGTHSCGGRVRL